MTRVGNVPDDGRACQARGRSLTLKEVQDAFQKAVMEGDDAVLALIPPNSRTTSHVLIGVYRHAYVARIADIIAGDYARLSDYMGSDQFMPMARAYLAAHPSRTPNARYVSHGVPEFLAATAPYRDHPELAELARLERAIADAFDAADAEIAMLQSLVTVPPEDWGKLRLVPHPSVQRLDFSTNAFDIWDALKAQTAPPRAMSIQEPQRLVIWREGTTSKVRVMGAEEAMLLDEAARGATFGALCELAAVYDDPDRAAERAARALAGWLGAGLLSRAGVDARRQ